MLFDLPLQLVPVFVLVLFRIAGLMLYAPLLGSAMIPKRVKGLLAIVLAMGLAGTIKPGVMLPQTPWALAAAIAGELFFGFAMGMVLSFIFIAAQWAGQIIGQQIGFNLGEVFDPQFGGASSVVGDLYYMLTLVIFLTVNGHRQMICGIRDSFDSMPLLSVGVNASVFDLIIRMFSTTTTLAIRLAAPVLVTIMVVDLTLGFLGKTMPQLNVMSAGMSVKAMVGILVLVLALTLNTTPNVIVEAVNDSMNVARSVWRSPTVFAPVARHR